jgi:hypothetical protein
MLIGTGRHSRVSFNSRTFIGLLRATNFHSTMGRVVGSMRIGIASSFASVTRIAFVAGLGVILVGAAFTLVLRQMSFRLRVWPSFAFRNRCLEYFGDYGGERLGFTLGFVVNDSPHARKFRRESQKTEGTPEFIQSDGIGAEGLLG